MTSIDDAMRKRWSDYRQTWRMTEADLESDDFAAGGLVRLVREPTVRVLLLPSDPAWPNLPFSANVRAVLPTQPVTPWGRQLGMFNRQVLTSDALARVAVSGREDDGPPWVSYVAIHRNGAIEMEMGDNGGWVREVDGVQQRRLYLCPIVHWTWTALELRRQLVEAAELTSGALEVTIALRRIEGAPAMDLGEGWRDPVDALDVRVPVAVEPNALVRYETEDTADSDATKATAMEIGNRIDNVFGSADARHLDRVGANAGELHMGRP
jgi:hypothetical protein